ncbi:MAG: DUF4143 domain-containing protein [Rhodothermia bacterium]|nr:MAG: DUF4143 domain-containing protein [Rhodothermia bacterium]
MVYFSGKLLLKCFLMTYLTRIIDSELTAQLGSVGAVVLEGPKACGKTETARQHAESEVLLDIDTHAQAAVDVDPSLILQGATPRLIDEWQIMPKIWNHIRREIDDRATLGQFILTGSAVPSDDVTRHSGAGRLTRIRMRPMSLFETGHANGEISVAALLNQASVRSTDPGITVQQLSERIAVGGWPGNLDLSIEQQTRAVRSYLAEIQRVDVGRVDQTHRNPQKVGQLLKSLARNVATTTATATLSRDTSGAETPINEETTSSYLNALERLMVIEDQPAWSPNLRSRARLRLASKRHFVDPSLAVAALRATPSRLLEDLNLFGFLFESLVVRDFRIYAQASDAMVYHYRDSNDLEVDIVIEAADGRWAAFEVKLGQGKVDSAAANLNKLTEHIDTSNMTTLGVIVSNGLGYVRKDGIAVIPIGALGP